MTSPPILRAGPDDAAVVGRLLFDFNTEYECPGPGAGEFGARFARLLERDDVVVLLTGDAKDPTGFLLVTFRPTPYYDGPLAQLEELYVRPQLRGQGIGTAMLTHLMVLLHERRTGEIHINVDEIDTDARRFYERHGFVNIEPGNDYRMLCYLRELTR
jgi:ribosomal protein S18 acetylase RimI-like enzyme